MALAPLVCAFLLIRSYAAMLSPNCCSAKKVGGVLYTLHDEKAKPRDQRCMNGCVYRKDGDPSSLFCFASGYEPVECIGKEIPDGTEFPCEIDVGDNGCSGILEVTKGNFTLNISATKSKLNGCSPQNGSEFIVFSNSNWCQGYEFLLFNNVTIDPNKIIFSTVWPPTLPCPLIGFDIAQYVTDNPCPPGTVQPGNCTAYNDCFMGPNSWGECASQCLGVTGGNTPETEHRGRYDAWSFLSRAAGKYAGNCCCKNIKNGVFKGNQTASIMGNSKCLGAGSHSY